MTVLRGFFVNVASKNYAPAWVAFTKKSQQGIIQSISTDEKMKPADVEKLFKKNAQSVQDGFWDHFRTSSNASVFSGVAMAAATPPAGADGAVNITMSNGKLILIRMYKEGGKWKIGWIETFFPNGVPQPPKKAK